METVIHTIEPVFDKQSRVLLLGTMPSPKSREAEFFYSHPQNRMWKVLAGVFEEPVPMGKEERRAFLLSHHIAMWDVCRTCTIERADDNSIRDVEPNDLGIILETTPIAAIFTTGKKAAALYKKYILPKTGREAVCLPSTSPANCRYETLETLTRAYGALRAYI